MAVTPTYPGVYVQEVPSGVRTIAGVGTSTAVFVGRTQRGPLDEPVRCLDYARFETTFGSEFAGGDLARSVRLFFENGGTECWVVRVAEGAVPAEVVLRNEAGANVLRARARSAGRAGESIRLAVTYAGPNPESEFTLEVFRWVQRPGGALVREDVERYTGLTMEPNRPRTAADLVTQSSRLVELEDVSAGGLADGISRSGRTVAAQNNTVFRDAWRLLVGTNAVGGQNRFRLSVDGGPFVDVDLSGIDFDVPPLDSTTNIRNNLAAAIVGAITPALPPGAPAVTVAFPQGPSGVPGGTPISTTRQLQISAPNEVRIQPAGTNDLAVPLQLGAAQGGLERSRHAVRRPAPTGMVFRATDANLTTFAETQQDAFDAVVVDGVEIPLGTALVTDAAARMFHETAGADTAGDGLARLAGKWGTIAAAINGERASDPSFAWTAEVWGSRIALVRADGGDNAQGTIATGTAGGGGTDIGGTFAVNVRHYTLGTTGGGAFQTAGVPGDDGTAPTLARYRDAFAAIDREVDLFNLLVLPRDHDHLAATWESLHGPASTFCEDKRAFLLVDPHPDWRSADDAVSPTATPPGVNQLRVGVVTDHAAVFFPRVRIREGERDVTVGPTGAIAGLFARIDSSRGVWKAPAGTEADLRGVRGLELRLTDAENGILNPRAVNTIRAFPSGIVNWGARTLDGDDGSPSDYRYIPIRRLALFIEESLYRGLEWAVFEPNDEPLWAQIRLNVGAFMQDLFRKGAFEGATPREAYFVKCDAETTRPTDRNLGIVNIWVGFAPLKPAEFVILYLQQMAAQAEA